MEKPNNHFFPEQEELIMPLKKVSLNKVNTNTPFLISPNVAERTHSYGQKVLLNKKTTPEYHYIMNNWEKEYEDKSKFFVPENRWTHEVTREPELIEEFKYKIYLDADVKVQSSNEGMQLVTRTLHPYVEINKNPSEDYLNFYELNKDKYVHFFYNWIFRWTPKRNCKLLFYSNEEIEKQTLTKVPKFIVEYENSMPTIKVPFFVSKELFPKKTLIVHDSAIMYLEVIEEG
jgi:hypothetical protein